MKVKVMGAGYLKVQVRTGAGALPIEGAEIFISYTDGRMLLKTQTDKSGNTEPFRIQAPDARFTLDPDYRGRTYSAVNVVTKKSGFVTIHVRNVQIFDTVTTILPQNMEPLINGKATDKYIAVPPPGISSDAGNRRQTAPPPAAAETALSGSAFPESELFAQSFSIPKYITVHLGDPHDAAARNITVRFADYIKNTASCEVYPTWPKNAIEANISVITTFALNRIHTGWYPDRGYNFDITGSPVYDIRYCEDGPVFDSISNAADNLYGVYARKSGSDAPASTHFCSGAAASCDGFSQWGSLTLANQGRAPQEILRYYYPGLELGRGGGILSARNKTAREYPGTPLETGSAGCGVRLMQTCLSALRASYPALPAVKADGIFGHGTRDAVTGFQKLCGLIPDGIIGPDTWYAIIDQTDKMA